MRTTSMLSGVAGVLLIAGTTLAQMNFTATLTGSQETPPNGTTANGFGTFTLNAAQDQLSFNIVYMGLSGSSLSGAHIHNAPLGLPGGIVKNLQPFGPDGFPSGSFVGLWTSTDVAQPLDASDVSALLAGNLYVNLHTSPSFGGGEIRGQIVPEPASLLLVAVGMSWMVGRRRRLVSGSRAVQ